MKIAVCTTFNNETFDICAAEMLQSFAEHWPKDIKMYIQLDEQPEDTFNHLNNQIVSIMGEGRVFIAGKWDDDQKAFMERWKEHQPRNYLDDVVKFSHKVFALEKCADALKDTVDYLIWLDSDVITKQPLDYEWLKTVLPAEDEVCSYLGREGWYSECGWVAYNLKAGGNDLLQNMKKYYTEDKFRKLTTGCTDCHVFDDARKDMKALNLSPFYVKDVTDIDVWPDSKLSEKMVHRKGQRKHQAVQKQKSSVVDAGDVKIKTKNCLDHKKICSNVNENLSQIRSWATICKPGYEDIVICSAGPSLSEYIEEIRELQNNGAKIIAVKHAIDTLKMHRIKPWAVVLLDPRAHVEGFVKDPDPEPFYFVASMCDPSVVRTLNEHRCKVIGYHALVNAGEVNLMIHSDLPVSGGSATATRSIGLFADMFGYRNFHLYGYDLCHHQKPDLNKHENGMPKYMELSLGTHTYGNKYITRTFWTEGQFLAQSNEIQNLYKDRKDLKITVYGDGLAGWLFKHHTAHKQYQKEYNERLNQKRINTPTLEEFLNAATRGSDLSRGV